jgi:hypothetical protein
MAAGVRMDDHGPLEICPDGITWGDSFRLEDP